MMRLKTIGLSLLVLLALGFHAGCLLDSMGLLNQTDTIVSSPPPDGCLGEYYVYDLNAYIRVSNAAAGLEFTMTSGTLPRGLVLDSATGVISGVPEEAGDVPFNFHINVYDTTPARNLLQQEDFTIWIKRFSIVTTTLPPVCAGVTYNGALAVCGGTPPFTWDIIDAAPSPFPFHFSSAGPTPERGNYLTGAPAAAEEYTFTVRVTDSSAPAGSASRQFTLAVSDSLRITSSHYLPVGAVGLTYGPVTLAACGGASPYIWEEEEEEPESGSSMPPGLILAGNGVISGTPTAGGIYTPVLLVRDNDHNAVTQNFVFEIAARPMDTRPITFRLEECVIASTPLRIPGGLGERIWQLAPGQTMPYDLRVDINGNLTGIPNTPGLFPVVFHIFDALSGPTNPYVVTVNFDVAENPPDNGFAIERMRQFTASPTDPEYDPELMNKIFLEITNPVVVEWLFTDPAWGASWDDYLDSDESRLQARLKIIGNCGGEITAGSYGSGDRDGDGDIEYVARFSIDEVRGLIESVGAGAGSRCSFRLILSFTLPNPADPTGTITDRIVDIEILNTPE